MCRVGQKTLLCAREVLDVEPSLLGRDLQFVCEVQHDASREAIQDSALAGRGTQTAVLNHKKIAGGAFRQFISVVEHYTFIVADGYGVHCGHIIDEKI